MSKFEVPAGGITIEPSDPTKTPSQTLRLGLPTLDAQSLIKHLQDGGTAKFKVGKILAVEYGPKRVPLHRGTDTHPQEVFARKADSDNSMHFIGKVSHMLEVQHAREALLKSDAALKALKSQVDQAREERLSNESGIVSNKHLKPGHRPLPLSAGLKSSRPSSPFLSAGVSPRIGPTSAPLLLGQSKEEKIKQDAIKIPLIHLLAMGPWNPAVVAEKLRVKRALLDPILLRVAKDEPQGMKSLKDRQFRDLDVWKFPYASQGDRQKAIDNAISAFDRQRIDKTDKLWQMLLAKEDRGKGMYLSKLNFDKPLNPGNLTPRVNERSTDGTSTGGKSMGSLGSGDSNGKGKSATAKATDKTKPSIDKMVKNLTKGISVTKESTKTIGKGTSTPKEPSVKRTLNVTKADSKIKSVEKIIDSDEEANAGPSIAAPRAKRPNPDLAKAPSSKKLPLGTVKSTPQRSQLSTPASAQREIERGRLALSTTAAKPRSGKDDATNKPSTASSSRNASRPRANVSPSKPSPLGSSPPTNGRDGDTSGTSSKGTPVSSAASTPPPPADTSRDSQKSVSSLQRPDKVINGVKRKADAHKDAPLAKKSQGRLNGAGAHRLEGRTGLPLAISDEIERKPIGKRESPESETPRHAEKPLTKEEIVEQARKFQRVYKRYKDLHEAASKQEDSKQRDDAIDRVWDMHTRLKEMKTKIWKEWERIESLES